MNSQVQQRGRRRFTQLLPSIRTLTFLLGVGTTFWVAIGWAGVKMREGRSALKVEKERKDRLRQHFSSTLTNISFTVYALLPTLSAQLFTLLDVEGTIAELTELASASSSERAKSLESSGILEDAHGGEHKQGEVGGTGSGGTGGLNNEVGETPRGSMLFTQMDGSTTPAPAVPQATAADVVQGDNSSQTIMPPHASWATEFTSSQAYLSGRDRRTSMDRSAIETASDMSDLGGMTSVSDLDVSLSEVDVGREHRDSGAHGSAPHSGSFTNASLPTNTSPGDSFGMSLPRSSPSPSESSAINLPSGDISSNSLSPTTHPAEAIPSSSEPVKEKKTKAQLWNEVKIKSITRSITSIYVIPLLILQTTSQLTLLSRLHLLRGLSRESTEPESSEEESPKQWASEFQAVAPELQAVLRKAKATGKAGVASAWQPWTYFSVEAMGLADAAGEREGGRETSSAPGVLGSLSGVFDSVTSMVYSQLSGARIEGKEDVPPIPLERAVDAEAERAFLCFSWWFLHIGWRVLEARVELAVQEIFAGVGLKKSLTLEDWAELLRQVRVKVEAESTEDGSIKPFDLIPLLLPPSDEGALQRALDGHPDREDCPISLPPDGSPLAELLQQKRLHLLSSDFMLVLPLCIEALHQNLLAGLQGDLYPDALANPADTKQSSARKVVECLPSFSKWSKRVWEGMPDEAVDRVLGMREVESFTALIYGDFGEASASQ